jgi:hypothetical protein
MRDALNSTGRHIYYSMCIWGIERPWLWGSDVANSWRTTQDIKNGEGVLRLRLDKRINPIPRQITNRPIDPSHSPPPTNLPIRLGLSDTCRR